jgi:hypothetical protein
MTIYSRYEEVEIIGAADDTHTDAGSSGSPSNNPA